MMNAKHTLEQENLEKVVVELCRSNSIGSNYHSPTVVCWQQCNKQRAAELLNKKMTNGYFYRIKADGQNGGA